MAAIIMNRKILKSTKPFQRGMITARSERPMISVPMPAMIRKLRKTGSTGGRSSLGKSFRPLTSAVVSWNARKLSAPGTEAVAIAFRSLAASGHNSRCIGAPFWVSQTDSIAANLVGCTLAISTAWKSPVARTARLEIRENIAAVLNERVKKSTSFFFSRCQAAIPIMKKPANT